MIFLNSVRLLRDSFLRISFLVCHISFISVGRKFSWSHPDSEGPDQPAHPLNLIRTFTLTKELAYDVERRPLSNSTMFLADLDMFSSHMF